MTAGNPKLTARKVLTTNAEVTYGVDNIVSPKGLLVSNLNCVPMAASVAKRAHAYPTFGGDPSELAQIYRTLSFEVELAGSGVAGTAPYIDSVLQACGMLATVNVGVSNVYVPLSAPPVPSSCHHFFQDGLKHVLTGTRGNWQLKAAGGTIPMLSFSMSGIFTAVTDTAAPDVHTDLEAQLDQGEVNLANSIFTLFGQSVVMESLALDFGNKVIFRDRPNAAEIVITERLATGTVSFEAPTIATHDWISIAKAKTTGALNYVQGTVAGNIVTIAAPRVRLLNPTYQDVNGVLHLQAGIELCRVAGDDELSITYT